MYLLASSASQSYEYSNKLTWLASGFSGINSYLLEVAGFLNFSGDCRAAAADVLMGGVLSRLFQRAHNYLLHLSG